MKKILTLLLCCGLFLTGCSKGISQTEYDALSEEKVSLQNEKEEYAKQVEELSAKEKDLEQQIAKLTKDYEDSQKKERGAGRRIWTVSQPVCRGGRSRKG